MMRAVVVVGVFLLASCGTEAPAPAPSPIPSTFSISSADLVRETPTDFCRATDEDFLTKLMGRVSGQSGFASDAVEFHDFNVTDPNPEGERSAVLRVNIAPIGFAHRIRRYQSEFVFDRTHGDATGPKYAFRLR